MPHSLLTLLALPFQTRCLPVHELDRTRIAAPRLSPGAYVAGKGFSKDTKYPNIGQLNFTFWQLVHAIRQAELLRTSNPWNFRITTLGLFLECTEFLADDANMRLVPGAVSLYGDFSRTALAGRIAQGITFLFMHERGYTYGERFEALLARQDQSSTMSPVPWGLQNNVQIRGRLGKTPDFLFETNAHPVKTALAESKGSFVTPGTRTNVKGPLKSGLQQIANWDSLILPSPNESFVVGTFLREEGDQFPEPSFVAFVDPENDLNDNPKKSLPKEAIRIGHYAAWLKGMGFIRLSAALLGRRRDGTRQKIRLTVATINDKEYVLVPELTPWSPFFLPYLPPWINPLKANDYLRFMLERAHEDLLVMGLSIEVMRRLSDFSFKSDVQSLMDLPDFKMIQVENGSAFNDGTFLGAILADQVKHLNLRHEPFDL